MLEKLLQNRRSIRQYDPGKIEQESVIKLLWAAVGRNKFKRTCPSAGACYPLEAYVVVGEVEELAVGLYHYDINMGILVKICDGDLRKDLCAAALSQQSVANAQIDIIIAADFNRTLRRYSRGQKYVYMEAGHAGQNVALQAMLLGLGTVMIGAFSSAVKGVLGISEEPLYIIPVGLKVLL